MVELCIPKKPKIFVFRFKRFLAGKWRHKIDGKIKIRRYSKTNKAQTNEKFKISFYLAIFCVSLRPIRPPCFLKLRRSTFQEKKIKIYGAPMKPSELFCFRDTVNFAALLFFLARGNKKFQRAMMQMNPPDD